MQHTKKTEKKTTTLYIYDKRSSHTKWFYDGFCSFYWNGAHNAFTTRGNTYTDRHKKVYTSRKWRKTECCQSLWKICFHTFFSNYWTAGLHPRVTCEYSDESVTSVDFPSQRYAYNPALWIQSHKPRGYWPIELVGHHGIRVACVFVSCEQLRAAVSATDGCEACVIRSGTCSFDVIACDAPDKIFPALCSNFR